ncbi:hypothetical protein BASA62_002636 [Batrachochytrium salamandrivorans]|nr:hypothetical protein BASA62_002636 [Batrachochytrium salamandrivorans]
MWRTLHRSKVCHSTIIGHFRVLQRIPVLIQSRAHGTRYLMLARMDALCDSKKSHSDWAYSRHPPHSQLTIAYYATSRYSAHPFAHLVVECAPRKWPSRPRPLLLLKKNKLQFLDLLPVIQKSRLNAGRALDPGGENVYTCDLGGVLNGLRDLWTSVGWTVTVSMHYGDEA